MDWKQRFYITSWWTDMELETDGDGGGVALSSLIIVMMIIVMVTTMI